MTRQLNHNQTLGFCPMCMQNVQHTRTFSLRLFNWLDLISLRALKIFRIGPWYCYQCECKSFLLANPKRSAPTFNSLQLKSSFEIGFENEPAEPETSTATVASVGNYLKSEHSLVMRDKRSRKFSQKFRDATVLRILSGATTMTQARHELEVKETDLIDWIANLMKRKDERIDELLLVLQSMREKLPERLQVVLEDSENGNETVDLELGTVIEGKINPR